ncbi:hypothetical protein BDQ17DRAFT_1304564 [Cyathus striatus]|nr:hypothetical protein BDQ17DRAFT_1304564 [Cyathus striatus]
MKSIQKRLYTVLPRAAVSSPSPRTRSNSVSGSRSLYTTPSSPLSFFDTPPPPPSTRSGITSPNRLPLEVKPTELEGPPNPNSSNHGGQHNSHPPFSLALSAPTTNTSQSLSPNSPAHASLFPYSSLNGVHSQLVHPTQASQPQGHHHRSPKRQRLRYHFDVGAYGIPKKPRDPRPSRGIHSHPQPLSSTEDLSLAVQVGEDAYFVRDNAMGVADGVGGWGRLRPNDTHSRASSQPTPSALFARRLMHFCSAELDSTAYSPSQSPPLPRSPSPRPAFTFTQSQLHPRKSLATSSPSWYWSDPIPSSAAAAFGLSSSLPNPSSFPAYLDASDYEYEDEDLQHKLEDELAELEEGIDILNILERAYDKTINAHVVPSSELNPPPQIPQPNASVPLLAGSSTALLAVLDHAPQFKPSDSQQSQAPALSATNPSANASSSNNNNFNYAAGSLNCTLEQATSPDGYDAVIKIAHIGDCMGMLVRGEDIVWRSEEMWWNFNTPVQLGPSTPTTPRTAAHVFTLPVKADDILILASDGLSDNLWDEDVLDEVARFRQGFLASSSESESARTDEAAKAADRLLRRKTLAGMLSEALCSRARSISERKSARSCADGESEDEVPFARRAREVGKIFKGGKNDDISVIVAVISPAEEVNSQQPK